MDYKPATYGHYVYPKWADAIGWIIGLLPLVIIISISIHEIIKAPSHLKLKERIRTLIKPTEDWGPAGRPQWIPKQQKKKPKPQPPPIVKQKILINDRTPPGSVNDELSDDALQL